MGDNIIKLHKPKYISGTLILVAVFIQDDVDKLYELTKCIQQLRNIFIQETIVIIDNNSKNTVWYHLAKNLNIYIIKNQSNLYRYEAGAYNLALKYFRADRYLCIQGTIYFNNKIQEVLDENNMNAYVLSTTTNLDRDINGLNLINKYLNFMDMDNWNNDPLAIWCCFYCNNLFMEELINSGLMDLRCNNKNISCAYERLFGVFINRKLGHVKTINSSTFQKIFLNQQ